MHVPIIQILKKHRLRDTQPRRLVIEAMQKLKKPASPYDIQKWIAGRGKTVNTVTVYRIIDALATIGLVHRHPCSGQFVLCSLPDSSGCHGFLHCHSCGKVQEFCNLDLKKMEDAIAHKAGFAPTEHVTEIIGKCRECR